MIFIGICELSCTVISQLDNTATPLSYLYGEMFKVDMSCAVDDGVHKKLMFKCNGTRTLTDKGSQLAINMHTNIILYVHRIF